MNSRLLAISVKPFVKLAHAGAMSEAGGTRRAGTVSPYLDTARWGQRRPTWTARHAGTASPYLDGALGQRYLDGALGQRRPTWTARWDSVALPWVQSRVTILLVAIATFLFASQAADIVYDDTVSYLKKSFNAGVEFGDEVVLGCPFGSVRSCTIRSIAIGYVGDKFHGDERIRIRFYLNDGPLSPAGAKKPGTVAYDSGFFTITASSTGAIAQRDNLTVPNIPGGFTWTAEFQGVTGAETAGLLVCSPPIIGKNYDDYWERSGNGWLLKVLPGTPLSFSAMITASDVVPAEDLRVKIEILPIAQGVRPLRVQGPSGRRYLIEASDDALAWQGITNFTSTSTVTTCFDPKASLHPRRFYRAWKAYPSAPQVRLLLKTTGPGKVTFIVQGTAGRLYVIEHSRDLLTWATLTNLVTTAPETPFLPSSNFSRDAFRVKQ